MMSPAFRGHRPPGEEAPTWQEPLSVIKLITPYFTFPFDVLHLIKVGDCVTN